MSEFNKEELEIEKLFFKDFFEFGSKRYELFVSTIKGKYEKTKNLYEKKLLFVEINSYLNKALEDFGAYMFGLHQARNKKIALIRTLVTYKPTDGSIKKLIEGKKDKEIELLFGLNNIYKKTFKIKTKDRRKFIQSLVKNLKLFADEQHRNHKIYNKAKHGNVIVSSIKAIKPNSKSKKESIAVLNDNHEYPNVIPYSEEQFNTMCKNIIILKDQILEMICAYLAKYNPEAAADLRIIISTDNRRI
jgi:hypothetical protein